MDRAEILERDNYECQLCGGYGTQCHEIVPRSRASKKHPPVWLYDERNMVTLCAKCHVGDDANRRSVRVKLIAKLRKLYGEAMNQEPWKEYD